MPANGMKVVWAMYIMGTILGFVHDSIIGTKIDAEFAEHTFLRSEIGNVTAWTSLPCWR